MNVARKKIYFDVRKKCLSKSDAPRRFLSVEVSHPPPNLIGIMKSKIDDPKGKAIDARRLAIVEPVFSNIRVHKCLDRFTLRSKRKVNVQWKLFAVVRNIGKIMKYGLK